MTLQEARARAIKQSADGCVQHVNCRIVPIISGQYEVQVDGYFVSDWFDGTTVESYAGGERTD
jgi:hypothetical protein